MRVVFMGTPDFAVPCLEQLVADGYEIVGVVTQPDRPKGRGHTVTPPPVKVCALNHGLSVYQPGKIKTPEFTAFLKELAPEVIVVVAFGQILSKEILEIPPKGCINVHASLLPKYRGAAPIHWAVINGEEETGVTTMYMDVGLDTGDMIMKDSFPIALDDTVGIVHDKLASVGAKLLSRTLYAIEKGTVVRKQQNDTEATYAPILEKKHELINWHGEAQEVLNLIRGMNPWPGAYTYYNDKVMKVWAAKSISGYQGQGVPGKVLAAHAGQGLVVEVAKGKVVLLEEIQVQGSKRMSAKDFLRGHQVANETVLGQFGGSEKS